LSDPKPAYVGDYFIVKKSVTDTAMTPIPFKVVQIIDVTTSTELKVSWFTTGNIIRDYAGGENNDEEDMCYIAVKTKIYQQVSMLRQMKKIKEASHYLDQTICHSLLIVSIIMVYNLK
jgi:hypothetical protein